MQSQDFSAHRPSLSNALSWMSLIVLVQAPDRMLLSREILLSNHSSSSGVHRSARQSKRPHQGPRSASLSPNPWSRPSQPGCPVKIKTTSGKQEQWNGDNSVSLSYFLFKKTLSPFSCFFSETGRMRDFTFATLDEYIFGFPQLFLLQTGAVFFHIQQRFGCILEGAMVPRSFSAVLS